MTFNQAHVAEEGFINLGLTWVDDSGLHDSHWATIKFHRNSENLALKLGEEQPDGSFVYVSKYNTVHRISAAKVRPRWGQVINSGHSVPCLRTIENRPKGSSRGL